MHDHAELLDKLIDKHRRMYGDYFWYDEQDILMYGIGVMDSDPYLR